MLLSFKHYIIALFSRFKKIVALTLVLSGIILSSIWFYFNYSLPGYNTGYLEDFVLIDGPISIADTAKQSSGLTYNSDNHQLYLIVNNPTEIHVLSAEGQYIRKIELQGFEDTEGITYIGDDRFAVVLEKKGFMSWFKILPGTRIIKFDPEKMIKLYEYTLGNTGLEGITYSPKIKQLIVVKERNPKEIMSIKWPVNDTKSPIINTLWDSEIIPWWFVRGFSGVTYHDEAEHLFILSRRSRRIIETTLSGHEVGSFSLKIGSAGLTRVINKAEGIVISPEGVLYVCSEPNQLYLFKRKNKSIN